MKTKTQREPNRQENKPEMTNKFRGMKSTKLNIKLQKTKSLQLKESQKHNKLKVLGQMTQIHDTFPSSLSMVLMAIDQFFWLLLAPFLFA